MKSSGFYPFVVFSSCSLFGSLFVDLGLVSGFLDKIKVGSLFFIVGVFTKMLSPRARFFNLYRDYGL